MRLDAAIEEYLASLVGEGRSPRTVDAYRRDLALLRGVLGDGADVRAVTPADLLRFAGAPSVRLKADGTPRDQGTLNRARSAVRGLFGFLLRAWRIERDPSAVLRVKATEPPPAPVLSRSDETRLLAVIEEEGTWEAQRDALIVRTLLATGLRVSSLVALDRAGVEVEAERLVVPVKGGRRQAVAVPRGLAEALLEHATDGPVFATRQGARLSVRQVQMRLGGGAARAGIGGLHPHLLRHTFGTRRYAETKDLRAVQVALGHRSVVTTQRYVGVA